MFLIDLQQVMIANIMQQLKDGAELNESLIRHMVLNSIRAYNKKFKSAYGEMIICCDCSDSWRKDVFPYYKAHRKKTRDSSFADWNLIFQTLNKLKQELNENFHYRVISVAGAEADDIIAVLTKEFRDQEDILIISSDKDFVQLQTTPSVKQYAPVAKQYISTDNPKKFIFEHILRGDSSDGIPNFLSDDDCFLDDDKRQKPIRTKKVEEWMTMDIEDICEDNELMLRNFKRNQKLIDFDYIPEDLYNAILDEYEHIGLGNLTFNSMSMINYFMKHKLKNLMSSLEDFR